MSGLEVAGFVVGTLLASVDALINLYTEVDNHRDARAELPPLHREIKERAERMRVSIVRYFVGLREETVAKDVLTQAEAEFVGIKDELEAVKEKHGGRCSLRRKLELTKYAVKVRESNDKLQDLERQINTLGVILEGYGKLSLQLKGVLEAVQNNPASRDDPKITKVVKTIYTTLDESSENCGDVCVVPGQAKKLLDALSKSGIPKSLKHELSSMALKVWEDWKVDITDFEFVRKRNGDRKRIGKGGEADVYLAHMKLRDENGNVIAGKFMEVAVKQFVVRSSQAAMQFPIFIREVFLQKHAYHSCIVRTFGGYWPDEEEVELENEIEPFIVMERMTNNLLEKEVKEPLKSLDSKRRILHDVAEGIAHLHSRGIVHRDIKPENVLVNVVEGRIIGRAKVCDFGVSRKAHKTDIMSDSMQTSTGLAGTSPYRAPEAFSNTARNGSKTARDIWSFGVLMCEVLVPDFVEKLVKDFPEVLDVASVGGQLAERIQEKANRVLGDDVLGDIAIKCLSLDAKSRPRIEDVLELIANDVPTDEFHFMGCMSLGYREKEVIRFIRNRFDADAQVSNLVAAVATLEEEARREGSDVSTRNFLAYCYYFGIGVEKSEEEAISLYERGCAAEDTIAMCCLGAIHFCARAFADAVPLLENAAEMGCAKAMTWLSTCYLHGYGMDRDESGALKLVSSAAGLGNEEAQARLAEYCRVGIGMEKDEVKAIAMLNGLCASRNAFASMRLALWYKEGLGVDIDGGKAEELLGLARERGIAGSWVFNEERKCWVISVQ